jgi:hypothetical protein
MFSRQTQLVGGRKSSTSRRMFMKPYNCKKKSEIKHYLDIIYWIKLDAFLSDIHL